LRGIERVGGRMRKAVLGKAILGKAVLWNRRHGGCLFKAVEGGLLLVANLRTDSTSYSPKFIAPDIYGGITI